MSQVDSVVSTSTPDESLVSDNSSTGVKDAATVQEDVVKEKEKKKDSDYHNREGGLREEETSNDEIEDADELDQSPEREFEKPSNNLQRKIRSLIEYYFSDKKLKKHTSLLDRIRLYEEGYVRVKLFTTYSKVKALTMDCRVVAYSLRDSNILEVNEDSTLVRRRDPVPNHIQTARSCRIVAFNLPPKKHTVSAVAKLFEPFGEINLIHLLWPGKTIPDTFGRAVTEHMKKLNEVCVLVEFNKHEAAREAVTKLKNKDVGQKSIRVVRVSELFYREKKNYQHSGKQVDIDDKQAGEERSGANEPNIKNPNTKGSHVQEHAHTEEGGESPNSRSKAIDEENNEDA